MNTKELMKHLLRLDNNFCQESLKIGEKAWDNILSDEAVMVTGGHRDYITGRENIVKGMKNLYQLEDLYFVWEPRIADVSDDHTMGYTSGIYTRTYKYNGEKHKEIGKYTSIWKLIDGIWKIVLDVGNEEKVDINKGTYV